MLRNFVHQLRNDGLVIAEEEILLEGGSLVPEGKCIKLLFYNDEWNKLHMLIGIAKIDQSESSGGSSLEEESRNSVPSVLTGKKGESGVLRRSPTRHLKSDRDRDEERFFVSIQIEETFLRWLDDPEFIEPIDVIENLSSLI